MTQAADFRRSRFARNAFIGLALGSFVLLIFGVTMVKLSDQQSAYCAENPEDCTTSYGGDQ